MLLGLATSLSLTVEEVRYVGAAFSGGALPEAQPDQEAQPQGGAQEQEEASPTTCSQSSNSSKEELSPEAQEQPSRAPEPSRPQPSRAPEPSRRSQVARQVARSQVVRPARQSQVARSQVAHSQVSSQRRRKPCVRACGIELHLRWSRSKSRPPVQLFHCIQKEEVAAPKVQLFHQCGCSCSGQFHWHQWQRPPVQEFQCGCSSVEFQAAEDLEALAVPVHPGCSILQIWEHPGFLQSL